MNQIHVSIISIHLTMKVLQVKHQYEDPTAPTDEVVSHLQRGENFITQKLNVTFTENSSKILFQ